MKSCLVVDDSDVVRKVARHIFQSLKFDTREADSGQAALAECQAAMPDTILLDWHMPAMGSVEFLSTLRGLSNGGKPLVIYCATGEQLQGHRLGAEQRGRRIPAEALRPRGDPLEAGRGRPGLAAPTASPAAVIKLRRWPALAARHVREHPSPARRHGQAH